MGVEAPLVRFGRDCLVGNHNNYTKWLAGLIVYHVGLF